jgi:hypothetical protein
MGPIALPNASADAPTNSAGDAKISRPKANNAIKAGAANVPALLTKWRMSVSLRYPPAKAYLAARTTATIKATLSEILA